jgi:SRSO17 transposase
MRTHTPQLDSQVLDRLKAYSELFLPALRRKGYIDWAFVFLVGLIEDGDRKSVEPLVERVSWLPQCRGADPIQAAWHWLSKGKWDPEEPLAIYREVLRRRCDGPDSAFVLDDTSFPKKGEHSVGVAHQYCGALGKRANCQVAVSLHYATEKGHHPLSMRLHLPESWTSDKERLKTACVPEERWDYRTKHEIALELLDQAIAEGHQARYLLTDAGYGSSTPFRRGLQTRGLTYAVGVRGEAVAFVEAPRWILPGDPRLPANQKNPRLDPASDKPRTLAEIAKDLPLRTCSWRGGTKGKLTGKFARIRVWPASEWRSGACAADKPEWLIVEQRGDELRYTLSNAPADISLVALVRLLKRRWPVEQGYQQLKEELGLDHFEGRSWIGLHHHICMTILAYGFLELERQRLDDIQKRAPRDPRATPKKSPAVHAPSDQAGTPTHPVC